MKPSLSLYYRVYPSWEEEQDYSRKYYEDGKKIELAKVWKRFDCEFDVPSFNLSNLSSEYSLSFDPFIDIIKKDKKIFKTGKKSISKL